MELSVRTLRARDNATTVGSNVDTGDSLIVPLELILQLKGIAHLAIELNARVASDSEGGLVSREGVIGNGAMEQMVNFGTCHLVCRGVWEAIGGALYYRNYVELSWGMADWRRRCRMLGG